MSLYQGQRDQCSGSLALLLYAPVPHRTPDTCPWQSQDWAAGLHARALSPQLSIGFCHLYTVYVGGGTAEEPPGRPGTLLSWSL